MKNLKTIFAAALVCLGMAAVASSCTKEDHAADDTAPATGSVEGNYTGDLTVTVMSQDIPFENLTVVLKETSEGTVSLTTPSFTYTTMTLPSVTVADMKATVSDGVCNLEQKEFSGTDESGKSYSGTVRGTVNGDVLTMEMSLKYGSMPMAMVISFTGDRN